MSATFLGVIEPREETMRRYGLDKAAWRRMVIEQDGRCAVCHKLPASKRLCIDHEHAKGWKKMDDTDRAAHVRGLCCYQCNRYHLARGMTPELASNVRAYLLAYERKAGDVVRAC